MKKIEEQKEQKVEQTKCFYSVDERKKELCITKRIKFEKEEKIEHFHFLLTKADKDEIFQLRLKRQKEKILFILKLEDEYWYAFVPKEMNGSIERATHLCGRPCKRLSALPDNKGGCAIVRDQTLDHYRRCGLSIKIAIKKSDRIEKYDFVKTGYEIFGSSGGSLVVTECSNYSCCH